MTNRTRHRAPAAIAITALLTACGGDGDDDSAVPAGTEPAPVTTAPAAAPTVPDDAGATADDQPTDGSEDGIPVDLPCPAPPTIPSLAPADEDALPFPPEGGGLRPGRYTTDVLGLSFAVDVPDLFDDAGAFGRAQGLFNLFGDSFAFLRPDEVGFVTDLPSDEESARGAEVETVTFDAWLGQEGVEVVVDEPTTVAGLDARRVRITTGEEAVTRFRDIPFGGDWNIQPSDEETLVVYVDLDPHEPLVLVGQSVRGFEGFDAVAEAMIDSLVVGGVGPTTQTVFAETPWDIGNVFRPDTVLAGCTVPALAFGGVEFELGATSAIQGQGAELWIFDPAKRHVGLREPFIHVVGPEFTMVGGTTGPPRPGDPVETLEDAVAELEAEGFDLTPLDDEVTILGSPAMSFDFVAPSVEPRLWFPRSNGVSDGFSFISGEFGTAGELHIAETPEGVVVISLHGEAGTDDADLLRDRFDTLLDTLRPATDDS